MGIKAKIWFNSTFRYRFGAVCVSIVYLRLMFKRQNPVFPFPFLSPPPVGGGWGGGGKGKT